MTHRFRHDSGFSLVELLLGLAITAIVMACVYTMFWSALKLDERLRGAHDVFMEALMANQALTHDLENAVTLDFSVSYPDAIIFEGKKDEFSCLTQTPRGIKRIRYYSGLPEDNPHTSFVTGRVVNPLSKEAQEAHNAGVFLLRQESSLSDWLNETSGSAPVIIAGGLEKGSFNCRYAPLEKDTQTHMPKSPVYKESWDDKGLPLAVACHFRILDLAKHQNAFDVERQVFLAPVSRQ